MNSNPPFLGNHLQQSYIYGSCYPVLDLVLSERTGTKTVSDHNAASFGVF